MAERGHILLGEDRQRRFGLWRWLFIAGLSLLAAHFAIWPYSFNVILTELNHGRSGFRLETMDSRLLAAGEVINYSAPTSRYSVIRPSSFTMASAIWLVPAKGDYRLELFCQDQGSLFINDQPVLSVGGVAGVYKNQTLYSLEAGPHLVVLFLANHGAGHLSLAVAPPGAVRAEPIPKEQLFFVELGNIRQWFNLIMAARWFLWFGLFLLSLSILLMLWRRRGKGRRNWEYGS